jgi:hypothetical protein
MTNEIRIMQKFYITVYDIKQNREQTYIYQNYFAAASNFAPFQVQGSVSTLGGDNSQIQILLPTTDYAIALVECGDGNRKSQLILETYLISSSEQVPENPFATEVYVGIGASFSEDTIELRFNTAIDAVASNFPAQRLNEGNVGILPLDSSLSLR